MRILKLQKRNFKIDPFWIELEINGRTVSSVWSEKARIRYFRENADWQLTVGQCDAFIHADRIAFK